MVSIVFYTIIFKVCHWFYSKFDKWREVNKSCKLLFAKVKHFF